MAAFYGGLHKIPLAETLDMLYAVRDTYFSVNVQGELF